MIAEDRNIKVIPFQKQTKLLGMYTTIKNNRFIMYNEYVPEYMQKMTIGHEIGHDTFHRTMARASPFKEYELFNIVNEAEYEANIFAAHLLLDENMILELAYKGYTDVQMASILGVNVNMLIFKIHEMNKQGAGLKLRESPRSDFFRDIDGRNRLY